MNPSITHTIPAAHAPMCVLKIARDAYIIMQTVIIIIIIIIIIIYCGVERNVL